MLGRDSAIPSVRSVNRSLTACHQFAAQLHDDRLTAVERRPASRRIFALQMIRSSIVSSELRHIGFADPRQRRERRRAVAVAQLIATVALAVSIAVAAAAVSIGIARAGSPTPV